MELFKKYGPYLGVLAVGLFLGYLISGKQGDARPTQQESHVAHPQMYSCSMHPEVQQPEKGNCPLCGMALTPMATSDNALADNQFQMTENAMALANIVTTKIGIENLEGNRIVLSGTINANEQTNAIQTTVFDGRIEKLNVNYVGEYIKKGSQLGMIYSPKLYAAQDKLLTSASYKDTHQKLYAAARNTLDLWKMTDAQIDEVLKTGKPLMNFPLVADVSGTVTEVLATAGKWYKEGDPIFKVSDLYTVWAVFDAYESQLPLLEVGQKIRITSNAQLGKEYQAKISFIEPVLNNAKRTVSVRATLINKEGVLKPGMFVEGEVQADVPTAVLTVPKSAVLWTGRRSLVYVKPDPSRPIFEMVDVTLGNAIGDAYEVLDGLESGEEVVVNGTFTVDATAQLKGKKSMMGSKQGNRTASNIENGSPAVNFEANFKDRFAEMLDTYAILKDALVKTDADGAVKGSKKMIEQLIQLKESAMLDGMTQSHLKQIKEKALAISETVDIKLQRRAFKPLSENMVAIASMMNDFDQPLYVQFCPMADGNKGASWLSFDSKIRNPYYGDAMLSCGSVTKTIQ